MNRNLLFRKYFAIGIIISFLGISVLPSMARPEVIPPNFLPPQNIFFGIQSNINISWDENLTKDPIDLLHSPPKIPLNVTFWITWGLFGRLLNFFFLYKKLNVDFVIDTSPWTGYSSLAFDQLPLYVPPKENIQQITMNQLTIQLEYDTPAYVPIPVTVRASIDLVLGPAGSLVLLRGTTYERAVYVMARYRSGLGFNYPEGNEFETPPLVQVEVPLGIHNSGNGKSLIENEVHDLPPGWNVSLPSQLTLEQDEQKEILITLTAPTNFSGYENIFLYFTPHYYYNYSDMGSTRVILLYVMYNQR